MSIIFSFKHKNIFSFKKNGPTEFLYGLDYVKPRLPTRIIFANSYLSKHLFLKIVEKIIAHLSQTGIHFQIFLNNKNKINKNDLLFGVEDGVSFGLLFFKLLNTLNNKTVVLIQGLHDRYQRSPLFQCNRPLVYFYHALLNKADYILALSDYEKELLIRTFNINREKVKVFYFGADLNYWNKNKIPAQKKPPEFVLTIGNDMHRDYDMLINYYALKIPLKLVTKKINIDKQRQVNKDNLFQQYLKISNEKLREFYSLSKFVVIPLKTTYATSGLSTILQALAMEKPVLVANAPALRELFTDYQHVLYYETGNYQSFQRKLKEINDNQKLRNQLAKNGRKLVEEKFNSQNMGKNILKLFQTLVNT